MSRQTIFREIETERQCQDAKWGGPLHDDMHSESEWLVIALRHLGLAGNDRGVIEEERYRKQLIRVASLCVAAVESLDRKQERSNEAGVYEQGSGF